MATTCTIHTILIGTLLFLFGCSSVKTAPVQEEKKPYVLATTAIVGDLVAAIAGENMSTKILISGFIDPHSYEVVKGDREKISGASLIISSGLGLEHGASLKSLFLAHPVHIALGDYLPPELVIRDQGSMDPHFWMDVSLMALCPAYIAQGLAQIDPSNAALYQQRALALQKRLLALDSKIFQQMQGVPQEKRYLLSCHDAFNYYTRRYLATPPEKKDGRWKERCEAPEGLAPESQVKLHQLRAILSYVKAHQIEVIFPESHLPQDSLKKIVEAAHEEGLTLSIAPCPLYADTLGAPTSSAGNYQEMIQYDTTILAKGWMGHLFEGDHANCT